jgi:hypothetical protein
MAKTLTNAQRMARMARDRAVDKWGAARDANAFSEHVWNALVRAELHALLMANWRQDAPEDSDAGFWPAVAREMAALE